MTIDPIDTVTRFMDAWGKSYQDLIDSYRQVLTSDATWAQSGVPTCRSAEEAIGLVDSVLHERMGVETIEVEMLHIAANGNTVLTERIDRMRRADGSHVIDFEVSGTLEVTDQGQVRAWRDYFDPREALSIAGL